MQYSDYVAYFRNLAAASQRIDHFFRLFDEEFDDDLKRDLTGISLVLNEYDGELAYNRGNGSWTDKQAGSIMILGQFSRKNDTPDQFESKLSELKAIGLQLFARIFYDIANKTDCPDQIRRIQKSSIKYYRTPFITPNITGWYFEFDQFVTANSELTYDPDDWTS